METMCSSGRVQFRMNSSVPPSGGSLEIGNTWHHSREGLFEYSVPPSGGSLEIGNPRRTLWRDHPHTPVPPSGGSLEIGNGIRVVVNGPEEVDDHAGSPFGGIPRNWKLVSFVAPLTGRFCVPPSGGSLEIGNLPCNPQGTC